MKSKKGAIELSMTTIIVVVLGIALLITGFAFLGKVRGFLTTGTQQIFEKAQSEIKGIGDLKQPLTISPSSVTVPKDGGEVVSVYVYNLGKKDPASVKLTIKKDATGTLDVNQIDCKILGESISVKSGEFKEVQMNIADRGSPLTGADVYGCIVAATGDDLGGSAEDTISIKVGQKETTSLTG